MGIWDIFSKRNNYEVERNIVGDYFYTYVDGEINDRKFVDVAEKVKFCMNNPALMLALKLNADLFSLVKINSYKNGTISKDNYLHTVLPKPNPFQTWEQFLWDYKFWKDLGTAYVYNTYPLLKDSYLYCLNPANFKFTEEQDKDFAKIVESKKELDLILDQTIQYLDDQGNKKDFDLRDIKPFFNLSNGVSGNWFIGLSIIDSILPNLRLADELIRSQRINAEFSAKFVATDKEKSNVGAFTTFGDDEKRSTEKALRSSKSIHALKQPLDIQRFASDIAGLKLDEQYQSQYFFICKALGIPKDVAELYLNGGATFENQEKALGKYINQSLKPDADDLISYLESKFGIEELKADWNHLSFMQVFEKERAEIKEKNIDTLLKVREFYNDTEFKEMIRYEVDK